MLQLHTRYRTIEPRFENHLCHVKRRRTFLCVSVSVSVKWAGNPLLLAGMIRKDSVFKAPCLVL